MTDMFCASIDIQKMFRLSPAMGNRIWVTNNVNRSFEATIGDTDRLGSFCMQSAKHKPTHIGFAPFDAHKEPQTIAQNVVVVFLSL
jgi:hypothetical protein